VVVVSFNIVVPDVNVGAALAANATFLLLLFSTIDRIRSNYDNKQGDEFHLWNPLMESRIGIRL
jgi:hypothetical protein